KIFAARVSGASNEAHVRSHLAVGGFALNGAAGIVWVPSPFFYPARRGINVTAQRAFVRLGFLNMRGGFLKTINVIGQELLGHSDVDLPFRLLHQFFG